MFLSMNWIQDFVDLSGLDTLVSLVDGFEAGENRQLLQTGLMAGKYIT